MKRLLTLLIFAISLQTYAQLPDAFNFQATIRAESGDLLVNTNVNFKVTIYEGQGVGDTYVESHSVPTDDLGHVNFVVGYGQPSEGSMAEIDWSIGNYYMKVELDTGLGYVDMGDTQLLSVPYALYAMDSGGETGDLQSVLDAGSDANILLNDDNLEGLLITSSGGNNAQGYYSGIQSIISGSDGRNTALRGISSGENVFRNYGVWGIGTNSSGINAGVIGAGDSEVGFNRGVWGVGRNSQQRNEGIIGYAQVDSPNQATNLGVVGYAISPTDGSNYGVYASASGSETENRGLTGNAGHETTTALNYGVSGVAYGSEISNIAGGFYAEFGNTENGNNFGVSARASSTVGNGLTGNNYGILAQASGALNNYGIYATVTPSEGSNNYAGYFSGDVYVDQSGYLKAVNPPIADNDVVNKGYLMEILASYQSQIDNLQSQIGTTNIGVIPSNIPLDGLYAYYPFNGNADDVIGDNFGTVVNNASLTFDRFGVDNKAYYFDGSDDYISLYEPWFDGNSSVSAFTYSLWIFVDQYPDEQSSINAKEGYWRTIGLQLGTSGHIVFGGSQPSPNAYHDWVTPSGVIDVGQWNHIAVTFANSNLRIYINGQLSVNETASISDWDFSWFESGNSTNTNLIGAVAPASGVTKFFNGKIDDFAIWSRALTENEVAELNDF